MRVFWTSVWLGLLLVLLFASQADESIVDAARHSATSLSQPTHQRNIKTESPGIAFDINVDLLGTFSFPTSVENSYPFVDQKSALSIPTISPVIDTTVPVSPAPGHPTRRDDSMPGKAAMLTSVSRLQLRNSRGRLEKHTYTRVRSHECRISTITMAA